ncbi:MAG: glycosyltransferase family 2 protein [Bacteroidetes bacterium]|nr:glycosyltransferase family 2 protein [Rhodothermia bacterium]MCS7155430.1 glycosyltransferase family 2 protein [Bacteroidota bacterium]MCX7907477.1 glycosyltransferase family 2 protein [Bacteroidota bacterium]MDW8138471.1 glycosyltransferase family 2 protein [Bacteroidota bacterium]MDW8284592.1 glycosyltransferase family 2 protein [Bacteroidota bacterium]
MSSPDLSIVIPIYNEAAVLEELLKRLRAALAPLDLDWEVLFVDDGSQDGSWAVLERLAAEDSRVRALGLSRNFGHQRAISAGLEWARGRAVVVMDGDLQDPPELIPELLRRWQQGYEVVYAVRTRRREPWLMRTAYRIFYRLLSALAEVEIPLDAGDFGLIDRRVLEVMRRMPERSRFVRGLRSWSGFRQIGVPYERAARARGRSKYSWGKLLRLALDGLLAFSSAPLRLATWMGFFVSSISFVGIVLYLYRYFTTPRVPGFTTLIIALLFLGGIQLITIGIIGEYIGRIYEEVKQRPLYVVYRTLNLDPPPGASLS